MSYSYSVRINIIKRLLVTWIFFLILTSIVRNEIRENGLHLLMMI